MLCLCFFVNFFCFFVLIFCINFCMCCFLVFFFRWRLRSRFFCVCVRRGLLICEVVLSCVVLVMLMIIVFVFGWGMLLLICECVVLILLDWFVSRKNEAFSLVVGLRDGVKMFVCVWFICDELLFVIVVFWFFVFIGCFFGLCRFFSVKCLCVVGFFIVR